MSVVKPANPVTAACFALLLRNITANLSAPSETGYRCTQLSSELAARDSSQPTVPRMPLHSNRPTKVVACKHYQGGATTPRRTLLPPVDGIASLNGPSDLINDVSIPEYHLQRLHVSADGMGCPLPPDDILTKWLKDAAVACTQNNTTTSNSTTSAGAGSLRLIATKGQEGGVLAANAAAAAAPSSVIISWSPPPTWPESFTLLPLLAPWHPAGAPGWETPIKWMSYCLNVVSTRKAQQAGYTDALLISSDRLVLEGAGTGASPPLEDVSCCHVLDGPNFAIGWISNGTCYFPCSKTLGLLPSITQRLVADLVEEGEFLGLKKVECGVYRLRDVLGADEVFVMSTTRGAIPVTRIGDSILAMPSSSDGGSLVAQIADRLGKIGVL
jgi:branched-subunit amino acid aminotransferase/4-amino-4-deoxychorismate lyase